MTRSMLSLKDDMSLETSLPHEDGDPEIPSLKSKLQLKQLGALFVTALTQQEDGAEDGASVSAWEYLLTYLESTLSRGQVNQLSELPETQHYIHRALKHVQKHSENLGQLEIINRLSKLFPVIVERLKETIFLVSPDITTQTIKCKRAATTNSFNSSSPLHSYCPLKLPATFRGPSVQLNELLPAANKVSVEFYDVEKNFAHTFPTVPLTQHSARVTQRSHRKTKSTPGIMIVEPRAMLFPMLASEIQDEHFSRSDARTLFPKKQIRSPKKNIEKGASQVSEMRSVYDVIEAFSTGKLKSESESIYFNYTNSDKWNPYDLTIVPKRKVQSEHFVVSKFGILQVHPDGTSDLQSFAGWLREASFYKMLRRSPFLKTYLVRRAFKQWYGNVRFAQFARFHRQVARLSIRFLPDFASALLKIQSLSEELLTVPFHQLVPLSNYDQETLEQAIQGSLSKAQRLLHKYFKYCRRFIMEVIKTTISQVIIFETDRRHKPFVSDLPLSVQKDKFSQLEKDLKAAKYQASNLANFVCLAEYILSTCILTLSKHGAQSWIDTVLTKEEDRVNFTPEFSSIVSSETRLSHTFCSAVDTESKQPPSGRSSPNADAFLLTSFELNETGELCVHPLPSDLKGLIAGQLQRICSILSSVVAPLTKSTAAQKSISRDEHQPTNDSNPQYSIPQAAPPSMALSRQPRSLLTVLKGISGDNRADGMMTSERARSELSEVTTRLLSGAGERADVLVTQGSPLETDKFVDKIKTDEVFLNCVTTIETAVERVCVELREMCSQYSWLSDVWKFITAWDGNEKIASMTADKYEVVLSQLHEWTDLVAQLPPRLPTSYSLLSVSTIPVAERVGPQLAAMLEELTAVGMQRATALCKEVLEDIKQRVEVLSAKRYDLEGFAEYTHQLRECQSFNKSEADNIDYVLRVHNSLLHHGVCIPKDDNALSMKLQLAWHAFRGKLKEAEVFVTAQTPMKAQGLQESIEACVEDLSALVRQVNEGEFINPAAIPNELLDELKLIQESVLAVRSRLLGLSKWKEAITGQPHDLSGVSSLMNQQYMRQELWKYRRVFDTYEREWVKTPFKKLDINHLSQKVSDWLTACTKLERTLSPDDPVVSAWRERLQEFKGRIPLLQQLSSKALKASHWYTIFASLGEDYNADYPYTLVDFDLYKMYDHSDIIFEICHDAMQQEKLRAKVDKLQSLLEQKTIAVNQFPIERYPFAVSKKSVDTSVPHRQATISPRKTSQVPRKVAVPNTPSKTTFSVGFHGLTKDSATLDCLFTIEHQNQLCLWLEDKLIQMKVLLSSPHLGNLKSRGEHLLKTLTELQEIVMMLSQCQDKWCELLSLFSQMDEDQYSSSGLTELQQGSSKYQEIVMSIRDDPRLLSLMGKRRGQKGFRDLQGEHLRQRIHDMESVLEIVIHKVQGRLKESCVQFPRLYYLSDKDILQLLSNNGRPIFIMPLLSRVFPAIKGMQLSEVVPNQSSTTFRKLASKSEEGLQVMLVEGWGGEQLPLSVPLPLGRRLAPQWLNALEGAISYSLAASLTNTIASLPDCLMGMSGSAPTDAAIIGWVSSNLSQCVQLSLELCWTSAIHSALLSEEPVTELKQTRSRLSNTIEFITELVRSLGRDSGKGTVKRSSFVVLQNLILILMHKTGILKAILDTKLAAVSCFNWRYRILYSTDTDTLYQDHCKIQIERSLASSFSSLAPSSKLTGKAASLGYRLQNSSHNLVASSKSLLSSKNNLLSTTKATNEHKSSATSSIVLTTELTSSRRSVPTKCMVHCGESIVPYGFEYLSLDSRLVLAPESEACILSMVNSLAQFNSCSLHGGPVSGKTETGREIAKVVGRHCQEFRCSPETTLSTVHRLLTGAVQTGSLLLIDNFVDLKLEVMILLGEWMHSLSLLFAKAFRGTLSEQEEAQSNAGLTNVESTSTIGPISLFNHQQSFKASSNHFHISKLPSNKTLTSQTDDPLTTSSLSHHLSRMPGHGIAASSSNKTSTPLPSHRTETPSQYHHSSMSGRTSRATTRMDWYKMVEDEAEWFGYGGAPKEELEFTGDLLRASPAFGCVLISSSNVQSRFEIPHQLRVALRSVGVMPPDLSWITEVLLLSNGFKSAHNLSRSFSKFWQVFGYQISSNSLNVSPPPSTVNLHALKLIINQAASVLHNTSDPGLSERKILVGSIKQYFSPELTHPGETEQREEIGEPISTTYELATWNKLNQLLDLHFPECCMSLGDDGGMDSRHELVELTDAVQAQLKEQHLQTLPSLVNKIQQLHLSLTSSKCVLLCGPSGSGKTMTYKTLASAYQYIRELRALGKSSKASKASNRFDNTKKCEQYPTIDITVLNPAAYTYDELFGFYNGSCDETGHQHWRDGILARIFRQIQSLDEGRASITTDTSREVESVVHWIVLNGPVDSMLTEMLASLVSGEGLFLSNGDKLNLPGSCQVLVETNSLAELSPSFIAHSPLLYFSGGVLTFDAVVDTWLDRAPTQHNLSAMSTETMANIIKKLLPETLEYLHKTNTKCLGTSYSLWASSQTYGLIETQSFLNFLSAVLERNSPKIESSVTHTGMASRSSRLSSRASSAVLNSFSSASMQEHSNVSMVTSKTSVSIEGEPLEPLPDDLSDCNLEVEFGLSLQFQMASMLTFSYIWSLGVFCPFSELSSFSDFAREMIGSYIPFEMSVPEEGSVFDYYLNLRQYKFLPWSERKGGGSKDVSASGYVSFPELDRYTYIIDLYISYGFNVMIVGGKGSGKSSLVQNVLQMQRPITRLPITPTLTAGQLQEKILTRVSDIEKRAGQRFSHRQSSPMKYLFFLDDVHVAARTNFGSGNKVSTVLELTRFVSTHRQLYDYSRNYLHTFNEARFICSCTPEEYWRLPIEFSRAFSSVPFLPPSDSCLRHIFSRSVLLWLQGFPETSIGDPEIFAEALGTASVAVIRSLADKICPSPSNPHFTFSLHDFMHVYEGLLLLSPDTKTKSQPQFSLLNRRGFLSSTQSDQSLRKKSSSKQKRRSLPSLSVGSNQNQLRSRKRGSSLAGNLLLNDQAQSTIRMVIRLWCHETTRVYLDRIVDSKDRIWFTKLLEVCIKYCFCGDDLSGSTTKSIPQQRQLGGTASYGSRRVRGGSMRGGILPQSSSDGPKLEDLVKMGVRVEVLQQLMPPGDGGSGLTKLLALDQVTMKGEDLTELIFAQFPKVANSNVEDSTSATDSPSDSPNYTELGDGQVMDILKMHIGDLNSGDGLVLFKGAIEHAARICRAMSLVGSHAMLIGTRGCGRRTLVRLMSQIFKAKLFEVRSAGNILKDTLRDVCVSAAVDSQPTVLLVTNTDALKSQDWEKVQLLMKNGLCPRLFTTSELLVMSSKLQKGRVKNTTDFAQQIFAKTVRKHLHVFIIWDVDNTTDTLFSTTTANNKSLGEEQMRAVFSSLCQACSYIDHVTSWTKQEYTDIALRSWQQGFSNTGGTAVRLQDWIDTSSQLEAVGMLATHIHLTTSELLTRINGRRSSTLISPKVFIESLRIAQELAVKFIAQEKVEETRLEMALQKMAQLDSTVYELEQELGVLKPQLAVAEQEVQQRMNQITTAKEKYMAANQRCKTAEDTINSETRNVERYSKMVEERFNEVSPVYYSALHALSSVKKNDTLEVMGYRNPPDVLKPVFDALCMLFDREQTWEDCQQLLISPNFFENLRFFDKDNVPKRKLHRLNKIISRHSKFEMLAQGSQAVISLCSWLNALIDYHNTKTAVQPFRESLAKAEKTLLDANKTFVEMRRDMMDTKLELEETVKVHKESVQKQRSVELEIEGIRSKLDHSNHLLSTISKQRQKWEESIKITKGRIDSLPGHAVLCSAAVCYLTRVPPNKHNDLLSAWLGYCNGSISLGNLSEDRGGLQSTQGYKVHGGQQQVVRIQKDFTVAAHFSEKAERSLWEQESTFPDQILLDRCLCTRFYCRAGSCSWPLVFDQYSQFKGYLEALEKQSITASQLERESSSTELGAVLQMDLQDSDVAQRLSKAMTTGRTVLLLIKNVTILQDEKENVNFLSKVFRRGYFRNGGQTFLDPSCSVLVHPHFKLYIVIEQSLEDVMQSTAYFNSVGSFCGNDWSSIFVVELGLSLKGLQSHLQKLILKYKKPEYSIRYKSLLTDLTLHHQQLENNERAVIDSVVDTPTSLLEVPDLLVTIQESESSDASTLELIHETNKNIRTFNQQSLAYKSLSEYSSLLYTCIRRLQQCFRYFKFPLDQFEVLFSEVLTNSSRGVKVPDNVMAINAHVLHLKHQLLSVVCNTLKVHLFERHQILLILLVGLEFMIHQGKLVSEEVEVLGRVLLLTEGQIDLSSSSSDPSSQYDPLKPSWISDESWCAVLQLQKGLPSFRRLSTEIVNHSCEWNEYLKSSPSLLMPVPGYGDNCSMPQKLLLWRVLRPEMFSEAAKDFILLTFGTDFTNTHPCTIGSILPYTNPTTPTLCYYSNSVSFPESLKRTEATRELCCVALIDEHHLVTIESQLSYLMQDGHWLVAENLQLCHNPSEMFSSLSKVLSELSKEVTVHPDFRVWIPLPLDCFVATDLGRGFAFEYKSFDFSPSSNQLICDLQTVINYTSTKDGASKTNSQKWEAHITLISKLQNFISQPLSLTDLAELDPNQDTSQNILPLIFEELASTNRILTSLQSSLWSLYNYLNGYLRFTAQIGATLTALSNNLIPANWAYSLSTDHGFPRTLVPALKLLRERFSVYASVLRSGAVPSETSLLMISKPDDLISRTMLSFAREHELHPCNVTVQAQVLLRPGDDQVHEPCLVLKDLLLHKATLDSHGHLVCDIHEGASSGQSCWVAVYFDNRENANKLILNCPVFINSAYRFTLPLVNTHCELDSISDKIYLSCDNTN